MNDETKPLTQRSTEEEADNIRRMLNQNFADLCATMDYANRMGFVVNFSIGLGPNGRYGANGLTIARHY